MVGSNTKFILLHISQNVTLPIVGEAVGDTAAKWPNIMAPSAPDGNIVQCVRRGSHSSPSLTAFAQAPLAGASSCSVAAGR
jgi:hypothetical protein